MTDLIVSFDTLYLDCEGTDTAYAFVSVE